MSELDLAAAVAAARRTADAVASDPTATRRRIRESLERRRGGRTRRFTLIGVLAATLFGSTAFAYYGKPWRHESTPASAPPAPVVADSIDDVDAPRLRERVVVDDVDAAREREIVDDVDGVDEVDDVDAVREREIVDAAREREILDTARERESVEDRPAPIVATSRGEGPRVDASRGEGPRADASRGESPRGEAPPQRVAQPDPELAAYRVAYDAHFHGGSPAAALAAWDAYLAAYPNGKLATDARYNRAIILVKLKRYREAANALRPLATAPEGAYRRGEAARLLNALPR
jgi:hypothetical protein